VVLIFNFNLGLDFTGGRIVNVSGFEYTEREQVQNIIRTEMEREEIHGMHFQTETRVTGEVVMSVRFPIPEVFTDLNETEIAAIFTRIQGNINIAMDGAGLTGMIEIGESESLSASASTDRILNVVISVSLALIGILIYMLFRFKINSGVAAIVGLMHDVLMMAALVAIFQIQVNFIFIVAMITIVAYSLNNTLVLFDRIRQKERDKDSRMSTTQIVDQSIKETFIRQLATTVTTIVPVMILAILGVPLIREMAIPILFGLFAGFFSTLFIVSPLYVRFEDARKRREKQKRSSQ